MKSSLIIASPDVEKALLDWQANLTGIRRLSKHTARAYGHDVSEFLRFITDYQGKPPNYNDLSELKITAFRAWVADLTRDNLSNRSRARAVSSVRNFFTWLDRQGILHNAAIKILRTPKLNKTLPRPITVTDAQNMMNDSDLFRSDWQGLRDKALFGLLYGCGLRIDEALSLNHGDFSHDDEMLMVTGKGQKQRRVPVLPAVRTYLETYISVCPHATEKGNPIFYGARGKRLNQGVAQREMRNVRVLLGLPDTLTPHALRHSFATHILQSGANIRVIQELLGHASLSSTQKYTELDIEDLRDTVSQFHPRG